jgi:hypothetical protein
MDFLGSITAVNLDRWTQLIARYSRLTPFPAREGVDPFTRDRLIYRAHPGDAHAVVAGKQVGMMTWAQDGTNRIAVEGDAELVEPVALEVAAELGGTYRRGV